MHKKLDLLVITLLPALTGLVLLFLHANFITSTILTFAPPAIWLSLKQPKLLKKILLFSSIISIPFTFMLDYLITKDYGWYIVRSVFSFRLFNQVAIEQFFWGFLYSFLVISFYEFFLDKKTKKSTIPLTKDMKIFTRLIYSALLIFTGLAAFKPDLLYLPYAYLILGTFLGTIPLLAFLINFPIFIGRFARAIIYFAYLSIVNEYVSLKLGHWIFPGSHFLGLINFFGYPVPYEEVFFYFILTTPVLLAYYEFFDDDRK